MGQSLVSRMNGSSGEKKKNGGTTAVNNNHPISKYYPKSTAIPSTFAFLDKTMNTIVGNTFGFKHPKAKTASSNGKVDTSVDDVSIVRSIPKKEVKKAAPVVADEKPIGKAETPSGDKIENEFENKENFPHENGVGENGISTEEVGAKVVEKATNGSRAESARKVPKEDVGVDQDTGNLLSNSQQKQKQMSIMDYVNGNSASSKKQSENNSVVNN